MKLFFSPPRPSKDHSSCCSQYTLWGICYYLEKSVECCRDISIASDDDGGGGSARD